MTTPPPSGVVPATTTRRRTAAPTTPIASRVRAARPSAKAPRNAASHDVTATLRVHRRGFGFCELDIPILTHAGPQTSAFISPDLLGDLLDRDVVAATVTVDSDGRLSARAITLTRAARRTVSGTLTAQGTLLLDPALGRGSRPVIIAAHLTAQAVTGAFIVATVSRTEPASTATPTLPSSLQYTATVVLADPRSAEALRQAALARHDVTTAPAPAAPHLASRPVVQRKDLTALLTMTMDGPSTLDLDDAISVLPADRTGALSVLVHIADVAAHVPAGSFADIAARTVGTSIYLPGLTLPMLNRTLSEAALSLLPGKIRDTITVQMRVLPDGRIAAVDLYRSSIRSDVRLTYTTASQLLAGVSAAQVMRDPADVGEITPEVIDAIAWLRTAGARLGITRMRRGGLSSHRIEPRRTVTSRKGDDRPVVTDDQPATPGDLLIERLMVAANESVARWLTDRGLQACFRIHPAPGEEAATAVEQLASILGFHAGIGPAVTPLALAALEAQMETVRPGIASQLWEALVAHLGRASYQPEPAEHFGLASTAYLHFTSPIRRYADLVVHRVIAAHLDGSAPARGQLATSATADLAGLCAHLNVVTGDASRAEADTRKAFWLQWLSVATAAEPERTWGARVLALTPRGVKVALDDSGAVGMLPSSVLPGYSRDEHGQFAFCRDGRRYSPGQRLTVTITLADPTQLVLELLEVGVPRHPAGTQSGSVKAVRVPARKPAAVSKVAPVKAAAAKATAQPQKKRVRGSAAGVSPSGSSTAAAGGDAPALNQPRALQPKKVGQRAGKKTAVPTSVRSDPVASAAAQRPPRPVGAARPKTAPPAKASAAQRAPTATAPAPAKDAAPGAAKRTVAPAAFLAMSFLSAP